MRRTDVDEFPAAERVVEVLKAVPGVKSVAFQSDEGRAPIDHLLGINKGHAEHFFVTFDDIYIRVQFAYRQKKRIYMSFEIQDPIPPTHTVAQVAARMNAVGDALEAAFPDFPRRSMFQEVIYDGLR